MGVMDIFFGPKEEAPKEKIAKERTSKSEVKPLEQPKAATPSNTDYNAGILKYFEECNIPGPDFLEFKKALENPAMMMIAEPQRFSAVFSSFQAMGIKPEKLVQTGEFYKSKISDKVRIFGGEMKVAREKYVNSKEEEVKRLTLENQKIVEQMTHNSNKINELNMEIQKDELRLNGEQNAFDSAIKNQQSQIETLIENIKKYLYVTTTTQQ